MIHFNLFEEGEPELLGSCMLQPRPTPGRFAQSFATLKTPRPNPLAMWSGPLGVDWFMLGV